LDRGLFARAPQVLEVGERVARRAVEPPLAVLETAVFEDRRLAARVDQAEPEELTVGEDLPVATDRL